MSNVENSNGNGVTMGTLAIFGLIILLINAGVTYLMGGAPSGSSSETAVVAQDVEIGDDALSQALFAHDVLEYGSEDAATKMRQLWEHPQYKAQMGQFVDQQHGALFAADLDDNAIELISQEFVKDGKGDADILIYEFSDIGCGYCQRQHEQDTLGEVVSQAGVDVDVYLGNVERRKIPETKQVICAGIVGGDKAYYAAQDHVMTGGSADGVAAATGLDADKLKACESSSDYTDHHSRTEQIAAQFGLGGTPGHLVINKKTKKYKKVEGAQPVSAFLAAIEEVK